MYVVYQFTKLKLKIIITVTISAFIQIIIDDILYIKVIQKVVKTPLTL